MDSSTASSLVNFINGQSSRFSASTMTFGERTWLILRDTRAPYTSPCEEPILDVLDYLYRPDRSAPLCAELRGLLEIWMAAVTEEKSGGWQSGQSLSRFPLTTGRDSDAPHLDATTH